jgi:hypothetical protein
MLKQIVDPFDPHHALDDKAIRTGIHYQSATHVLQYAFGVYFLTAGYWECNGTVAL